MGTMAISGCATGIGAATRERLEADGHRLIGIDLRDVEVPADLSSRAGRSSAVAAVLDQCGGRLDGLVLCAGLGGHIGDGARVAAVNYFGAVELLDGLFPALQKGQDPAAVVICSNSAQLSPDIGDSSLVAAMLDGDEAEALRLAAEEFSGQQVYMMSKNAVGRAVRRRTLEWGEAGVRLNAVAPGPIVTPLLQGALETPGDGDAIRAFKVPVGRMGRPDEIAGAVRYLLGSDAGFVHGSIWYVDGGADAFIRPDRF
jgi:NAD(P)-dependent dehydrogenase (short-subunit alcohol dehydrogenase family)